MLDVANVQAGYGETRVLHGISLAVHESEVVVLLGRNGAGKTTTLKTIMGLVRLKAGAIRFDGQAIGGLPPYTIAKHRIAYVPETRDIFPSLTVLENLTLPIALRAKSAKGLAPNQNWTLERVFEFFPRLAERRDNGGAQLSGGEAQMLAIARALLQNPRLLILDEPTEGLAPIIIDQLHDKLGELKRAGLTILLVEQNFGFATSLATRAYVLGRGAVQWQGTAAAIMADDAIQKKWIGV